MGCGTAYLLHHAFRLRRQRRKPQYRSCLSRKPATRFDRSSRLDQ